MALIYATSEFTDINNTDWKVDIVLDSAGSDTNFAFNLGPDGFNLSYDFDEYDRCKPIVGSRVQITLYHPKTDSVSFDNLYNFLDALEEGTFRLEIYRDPDITNELWWAGEILPEQTVIPDDYPYAPVTLTAVDGLANLKGIDYNNDGTPYVGTDKITKHLHNLIQKMHISSIWEAADIELRFFEDYIGKEYKDDIGGAQNKQLSNAKISHDAFYNKDESGDKQFFSCYEVLESLAITFNASIFMAQGSIWWVPLGAIQSHGSSGLEIVNHILGDGTVIYNTVENTSISALFGSGSAQWEKLNGFERSSAPSFKQVIRTRNYQGDKPVVMDTNYTRADIVAGTILDDEDIEYPVNRTFLISGVLRYDYPGDATAINGEKVARLKVGIKLRVGDADGADRYLSRATTYSDDNILLASTYFTDPPDTDEDEFWYRVAMQEEATWEAVDSNYEIISHTINKKLGTDNSQQGALFIAFAFITPPIAAATGLQLSIGELTGVTRLGANDGDLVGGTADFSVMDFKAHVYDDAQSQEFGTVDITATNPDTARYEFNQGTTLVGDRITDSDLGTIQIYDGSDYVDSSEWTNLQSSTASLSINGLGVRERLAANQLSRRMERGTLFQTGSTFIHPYTILTNSDHAGNFYQVTGLRFIASRSEYDIDCMFLTRNITGITVTQDNSKGSPGGGLPTAVPGPDTPGADNIVNDNSTKLGFITTDTYGITKVTTSTGSGGIDINLPITKSGAGSELIGIDVLGAMHPIADGASGEFLKTNGSGALSWAAAGGGGSDGWHGSTTLIKVMPTDFYMNDDYNRFPLMVEDDITGYLGVHTNSPVTELFAFITIPTAYKVTHVKVFASASTSLAVNYGSFNHTTGAVVSKNTFDFNSLTSVVNLTSGPTTNVYLKLIPASSSTVIMGANITITAV
jgi:hypothetical protein